MKQRTFKYLKRYEIEHYDHHGHGVDDAEYGRGYGQYGIEAHDGDA